MIFNSGYNLNPCGWTERYRAAIQPRRVLIALLTRWINVSLPHSSPLHDRPEPKKQDVQTLKRNLALWLRVGPLWQRNLLLFFFFFLLLRRLYDPVGRVAVQRHAPPTIPMYSPEPCSRDKRKGSNPIRMEDRCFFIKVSEAETCWLSVSRSLLVCHFICFLLSRTAEE